ncbi:MAG: DNA primase [Sphaerochaeta sp.]|uniref:DNA primase n=1 Tax=Sphaerochaeta sp. S2 TaxID=2798868 RepID=UPI0018EA0818|nr:DNA primase [Sphaerochaeta sp. S2]MCK9347828.1 DNA primase [Sphaerochaeta sp.]MBJ2357462.1 DNA primase [Sphaerochaeta sp. S2]MDD4300975.1 DNA primase [Sphaerochaeta sp.]MDD4647157.1 DNA primase [Sphaerochaeta sp.]MDY0243400.1 DNA primase [Sphaerochaeta sp.]
MAKISESVLEQIKARIPLSEVVSDYVTLSARGGRLWGLCPFHEEKTPSFSVVDEQGFYYCFSCKKGGSMFDFLMEMEKVSFVESVKMLARRANIELADETEEDKSKRDLKETLFELYDKIAGSFHYLLVHSRQAEQARAYLRERNVSEAMWERFNLGYAPSDGQWLYLFLRKHHYSDELLKQSGLFSQNNPRFPLFRDRLMFPIRNWQGKTVAFGGRDLSNTSKAKYINTPETMIYSKKHNLFGLYESLETIKKSQKAILCEGNFDVVALHQSGFTNAMAPLGTSFTEDQGKLLRRYCTSVQILFDSDRAGQSAAQKALVIAQDFGMENSVLMLKSAKDASELVQEKGEEALQNELQHAVQGFHYLVNNAVNQYDTLTPKGKTSVFHAVRPYLDVTQSSIEKQDLIKILASRLNVDESSILDDYSRKERVVVKPAVRNEERQIRALNPATISVDLYAMLTLVNNRDLYLQTRYKLAVEDLEDSEAEALYDVLEEAAREDVGKHDEYILQMIEDPQLRSDVASSFAMEEFRLAPVEVLNEAVNRIQLRNYEKRRLSNKRLLDISLQDGTEDEGIEELLREKTEIDAKIAQLKRTLGQEM